MTVAAIVNVVLACVSGIVGVWGAIMKVRAGKTAEGLEEARAALYAIIAGLELMPASDPRVTQAKLIIRQIGDITGAEKDTIAKTVDEVRKVLGEAGFAPRRDETSPAQIERAAKAIMAARLAVDPGRATPLPAIIKGGLILLICFTCNGCQLFTAEKPAPRLTSELIMPNADYDAPGLSWSGRRDILTVEWPKGVVATSVVTVDSQSSDGETRAVSVAPLPAIGQ